MRVRMQSFIFSIRKKIMRLKGLKIHNVLKIVRYALVMLESLVYMIPTF